MELEISWQIILKVICGGLFTYFIFPLVLIGRDLLLLKAMEKWIINPKLNSDIRMCESDRWFLNNKYNKTYGVAFKQSGNIYSIGEKKVTLEEFDQYEQGKKFHENRFYPVNAKINMKNNLLIWLTKHYKMDDFHNPISDLRKNYYEITEQNGSKKGA